MDTGTDSEIESDDVPVAEVVGVEEKILVQTADDLHLSQEPLSTQDFSTTTSLPFLEESGKNINAL